MRNILKEGKEKLRVAEPVCLFSFAAEKMIDLAQGWCTSDSTASVAVNNQPGVGKTLLGPSHPLHRERRGPFKRLLLSPRPRRGFPDTRLDAGVTRGGGWGDLCCMARKDKVKGRRQT